MKARRVRGIDRTLQGLRPIASGVHLDDANLGARRRRPGRRLKLRLLRGRAHIDPDETARFPRRIGLMLDMSAHPRAIVGLAGHVEDIALDVEFPAMIETAQTAFLVAAEDERGLPMRAMLAQHAEPAFAVAENDEVLAKEPRACRRAVGLRHLLRHAGRKPMPAHDLSHWRIAFDA